MRLDTTDEEHPHMGIHISPGVRNALLLGGLGIGLAAVATACGTSNEGRTGDGIARDLFKKYDKGQNGSSSAALDGFLELGKETFRSYNSTDSSCEVGYYYDGDGDGYADDWHCSVTRHDHYLVTYSADKIGRDADAHGNNDGFAHDAEVAAMIMDKFDVGYTDKNGNLVGAGNGKLDKPEAEKFNDAYSADAEDYVGREYQNSTYTYSLSTGESKEFKDLQSAIAAAKKDGVEVQTATSVKELDEQSSEPTGEGPSAGGEA